MLQNKIMINDDADLFYFGSFFFDTPHPALAWWKKGKERDRPAFKEAIYSYF
jgi:hypothetical protein